jgi:nickel-type superoxide dismutase maturation protease
MFRLLKVAGDSLTPAYRDGDYILVSSLPGYQRGLKTGDCIVFRHTDYGILVKIIERFANGNELFVTGTNPASTDSRTFGAIQRRDLIGKVIWHIPAPRR